METAIERIQGEKTCTVYTTERKFSNELRKMRDEYPDLVTLTEYDDGGILAHVPNEWFKFVKPKSLRNLSEEERKEIGERLKVGRVKKEAL